MKIDSKDEILKILKIVKMTFKMLLDNHPWKSTIFLILPFDAHCKKKMWTPLIGKDKINLSNLNWNCKLNTSRFTQEKRIFLLKKVKSLKSPSVLHVIAIIRLPFTFTPFSPDDLCIITTQNWFQHQKCTTSFDLNKKYVKNYVSRIRIFFFQ